MADKAVLKTKKGAALERFVRTFGASWTRRLPSNGPLPACDKRKLKRDE
jgi:hypothetical protein